MLNTVQRMVESVPCRQCPSDNLLMKSLPCNVHSFVLSPPQPRLVTVRPNGLWPAWLILVGVLIPPLTKGFCQPSLATSQWRDFVWRKLTDTAMPVNVCICLCWGQFPPLSLLRPIFTFVFVEANFHRCLSWGQFPPLSLWRPISTCIWRRSRCWAGMWRCMMVEGGCTSSTVQYFWTIWRWKVQLTNGPSLSLVPNLLVGQLQLHSTLLLMFQPSNSPHWPQNAPICLISINFLWGRERQIKLNQTKSG